MKKNLSDYFVALTVVACSLVLLGALLFALSGWGGKKGGRSYEVDFPDVTGIRVHSQVRYAGAPAGSVAGIRLLSPEERAAAPEEQRGNAVRVTVQLADSVPPIARDTRVSLSSNTLLSEKFVAFSAGSATAPQLARGTVLQGAGATSLDAVIEKIGPLVESLDPLLRTAESTLRQFDPLLRKTGDALDTFRDGIGDALPLISQLADSLKVTAESADGALKRIDGLIAESQGGIKSDLEKLKVALDQLKDTLASADRFLTHTDKSVDARMAELSVVLENLKVATTYAKAAFKTLGERPNRLIFGGKLNELPSEREILKTKKPVPLKPEAARR